MRSETGRLLTFPELGVSVDADPRASLPAKLLHGRYARQADEATVSFASVARDVRIGKRITLVVPSGREDAGHQALAADRAGVARAGPLAHINVQNDLGHGLASKRNRRAKAARRRRSVTPGVERCA